MLLAKDEGSSACKALWEKINNTETNIDCIVSPAMGGLLVGYNLSLHSKHPHVFLERDRAKPNKPFHLSARFTCAKEPILKEGARVLLVDDVLTTGKSLKEAMDALEKLRAEVIHIGCIVDRSTDESLVAKKIIRFKEDGKITSLSAF